MDSTFKYVITHTVIRNKLFGFKMSCGGDLYGGKDNV